MANFVRRMGSLVRGESSYSNEQDPWETDVPLSFQSVRRESHVKPPPSFRVPRAITLPSLLSLRSHIRNRSRNSNDCDNAPFSPVLSLRSVAVARQRVVDELSPGNGLSSHMRSRSFTDTGHKSIGSPSQASKSFIWKSKGVDIKQKKTSNTELGNLRNSHSKETRQVPNDDLEDIPPMSPVSEDAGNEGENSSRRKWIRDKVRRVLRLRRKERA